MAEDRGIESGAPRDTSNTFQWYISTWGDGTVWAVPDSEKQATFVGPKDYEMNWADPWDWERDPWPVWPT